MARITYNNGYYEGEVNSSGEEHGYGTFCWDNGEKYVGQFRNRKFNGTGTYTYRDGNKYVGQWRDDKRNGKGTMFFSDGGTYDGEWVDDMRYGFGRETYNWGYYEGNFKDDKWYGKGKEFHKSGVTFEGFYFGHTTATDVICVENGVKKYGKIENKVFIANNQAVKYETITYDNGSYEGYTKNGYRHGQGTYRWNSGDIYEGNWVNDIKSGYAKYTAKWGTYEGYYKNDARCGCGKETTADGTVYEGIWVDVNTSNDMLKIVNGFITKGKMVNGKFEATPLNNYKEETYGNGKYVGELTNGERNGYGKYTWHSGSYFEGTWANDSRNGYGRFFWTDGSHYEGTWANDRMNGQGSYFSSNGSYYVGEWKDDNKCYGKQFYSWGTYEGDWANKTWCGHGIEIVYGGAIYEADWTDAKNATNVVRTYSDGTVSYGKIVDGKFVSNQ